MTPSKYYCKFIIHRHIVVVDSGIAVEQNDAPSNSSDDDDDHDNVYSHMNCFPMATLAAGSETWAQFSQRIFNDSVIEASNSSRLFPLLVQSHPNQQRFTAYRLRFGYGYATLIFPTWRRTRRQMQQPRSSADEIIDALLDINVSICQSKDHPDDVDNNNSEQSNASSFNTNTATPTCFAAHETIVHSIGVLAHSTTTFIELRYHSMIGGASTTQSTALPSPVVKSRTNICYCVEDDNFPGRVADYELTTDGKSHFSSDNSSSIGGSRGRGGDARDDENRGYILPNAVINSLPLEGGVGQRRDINSSSSSGGGDAGARASNGGGWDASSSGGSDIVHPTRNTSTTTRIQASSNANIAKVDHSGSDVIRDCRDLDDGDARRQGGGDRSIGVEIEDESVDVDLGKDARARERKKKLTVKESAKPANRNKTSPPFDSFQISSSPARSTAVLDVEASPYSHKKRKFDTNDMKQTDSKPKKTVKGDKVKVATHSSVTELSCDKPGGRSTTTSPVPLRRKLVEGDNKVSTDNIQATARNIACELEGSLQKMVNLPKTNIHTTEPNNIFKKLDDAMTAAMRLTPPIINNSQSNQESSAVAIHLEKVQQEPSKKKSNIHTTSEKIARDLASAVAGEQKKAFAVEKRIPCKARGLPADHNRSSAYFVIPDGIDHGDELQCSHPACRIRKGFRYCQHCKFPIAKANFEKHGRDCVKRTRK